MNAGRWWYGVVGSAVGGSGSNDSGSQSLAGQLNRSDSVTVSQTMGVIRHSSVATAASPSCQTASSDFFHKIGDDVFDHWGVPLLVGDDGTSFQVGLEGRNSLS